MRKRLCHWTVFAEWTPELWPGSGLPRDPEIKQGLWGMFFSSYIPLDMSLLSSVLYLSLCWCFEDLLLSLLPVVLLMIYYCLSGFFPSFSACGSHNEQLQHPHTEPASPGNVQWQLEILLPHPALLSNESKKAFMGVRCRGEIKRVHKSGF